MATYRIYKNGITRIDEEYDPSNPYGSDSQDPAGRTYYCDAGQNAFSKAVDEAGYNENVKDTFVFMEEGSWRVPIVYERRFGLYKSISADNYARPLGVEGADVRYSSRQVIYESIPGRQYYDATSEQIAPSGPGVGGITSVYFFGSYPLQVSVKGGEYKTVRGFDVDVTGTNAASDYKFRVRHGQRTRNMDLLVRPGLEGGKVQLVFRSQTDDTDGYDGVESAYGLGMPGNEKNMLTRSGTSWLSWDFTYGIYLPFDRVYGVSFVSGGAGSLSSTTKKKTWRIPGVFLDAYFEKKITYEGWYASPREIDSCAVTDLSLDLWLTERITRTTFNSCPSSILPVREHARSSETLSGFRTIYGWARLSDPRIPDFTDKSSYSIIGGKEIDSSYVGDTTKRFRIVDSCKFYSCTATDSALMYAALVINCVFKNNTCAFPVAGFATNCAFVENLISLGEVVTHYTNRPWGGEAHASTLGGWSGHIYEIGDELQYRMSQGLITNSYLVKNTIAENVQPSFMVRNIETIHDQCIYRRYCIYNCVFDQIKTGGVLAVYACDEDETLVDQLDSEGIIRPEKSQYLLLRGRPSSAVFSEINGRLKAQDPGFAGIDSLQARDLYGKPRQYFDTGCVSIGPVSENIDVSFSVVRAFCASGFGKVYPSVQVCKKGTECSVQVDSYSAVDYVKVDGNSIAPSKRIRIIPSERFTEVEVGTKFAVGLSTASSGSDIEKRVAADGTDARPFACLQDAFKYIATRVGGSVPTTMNSYSNDAYTYADGAFPTYIFNVDSRNIEGLSYSLLDQRTIKNTCGRIEVHVFGGGLLNNRPNFIGDKRLIKYGDGSHYSFNNKPIVCYFDDRTDVDYLEEPVAGSVPVYYARVAGSTLYSGYVGMGCYINFETVLPDFYGHDSIRGGSFVNCRLRGYDCAVGGTKALACRIDTTRNFRKSNDSTKRFQGRYRMEFDSCSIDDGRASPNGLVLQKSDEILEGKTNVIAQSVKGCRINGLMVEGIEKSYVTNTETMPVSFRYSTLQPVTEGPGNTLIGWAMPDVVAYRRDTKLMKDTESYIDRDLPGIAAIAAGKDAADPIISRQACGILQDVTGIAVQDLRAGYSDALTFITLYGYSSFNDSASNLLVGRYSFDARLDTLRKYHAFLFDRMATVCGKKTYKSYTRKKKTSIAVSPITGATSTYTGYALVLGSFEIDIFNVFKDSPGKFVPVSPSEAEAASLSEENLLAFRTECAQNSVFVSNGKDVCMPVFFSDDLFKSIVNNNLSNDDTGFRKRLIVADDGRRFYGEQVRESSGDTEVDSCTYVRSVFEFLNDSRLELEQFTEKNTGRRFIGIDFDWFENFIGS